MKYILSTIGILLLITLKENIIWLILVVVIYVLYIHLIYDGKYSQPWQNDVNDWSAYYRHLSKEPVLKSIEDEYICVSVKLHDIDYRLLDNNHFQRPRLLLSAIINKYGLSNKFEELSAKKQKIKEEYMLAEKLIGVDHIPTKTQYKNKNSQSLFAGKYTLI